MTSDNRMLTPLTISSVLVISVLAIFTYVLLVASGSGESMQLSSREKALLNELEYLHHMPELKWLEVEEGNIYLGFSPVPEDLNAILRKAALTGNRAINSDVHVWAFDAAGQKWKMGDHVFIAETTARRGVIVD